MRVSFRFQIVNYAGTRSITLAVGLVLRNAADAVHLSSMVRILPQPVGDQRLLVLGSLALWPEYPQIASNTLAGNF